MQQFVKPAILSTFGDIALAIGPHLWTYLQPIAHILQHAGEADVDRVGLNFDTIVHAMR